MAPTPRAVWVGSRRLPTRPFPADPVPRSRRSPHERRFRTGRTRGHDRRSIGRTHPGSPLPPRKATTPIAIAHAMAPLRASTRAASGVRDAVGPRPWPQPVRADVRVGSIRGLHHHGPPSLREGCRAVAGPSVVGPGRPARTIGMSRAMSHQVTPSPVPPPPKHPQSIARPRAFAGRVRR